MARYPPDTVHALRFRNIPGWIFFVLTVYALLCLALFFEGIIPDMLSYFVILELGGLIVLLWELISVNMLTRPTPMERAELKELHMNMALQQEWATTAETAMGGDVYSSLVDRDDAPVTTAAPIERHLTAAMELQRQSHP